MNNKIKLIMILFTIFLIPGCAKYSIEMEISDDKSVSIEIITAYQDGYEEDSYVEEDREAAEDKGFRTELYNKDDYMGYRLIKTYDNIDDISSDQNVTVELRDILNIDKKEPTYYFQKKETFFYTIYIANFTVDTHDSLASYVNSMEYKVILPSKAINSNASTTSSDGKTLKWNLKSDSNNKITYEFQIKNKTVPIVIGGIIGLAAIVLIILKVNEKKRNLYNPYNNQNMYQNYMNNMNTNQNNIQIGNMDAADISMKDNYVNNLLPTQNMMYNNMNNMMYPTNINSMMYDNNNQNMNYNFNNQFQNNNTMNNIYDNQIYDNQQITYNNYVEDEIPDIDKPNLNNNTGSNSLPDEKHYELSSNKDIYN
ncbi:MAG: hypothetical protein IJN90_06115 [Bacilli bacterium]|nr:hypothetical protein [Bacilli bacterium]